MVPASFLFCHPFTSIILYSINDLFTPFKMKFSLLAATLISSAVAFAPFSVEVCHGWHGRRHGCF
jgi:hypothetical protein